MVYTPTAGSSNPTYTAVTITISCEITSWTISGAGSTSIAYSVFSPQTLINGSGLTFTQVPACGYTFTSSWAYTIPSGNAQSFVSQGTIVTPSFNVYTANTAFAGIYTLTFANTITVAAD